MIAYTDILKRMDKSAGTWKPVSEDLIDAIIEHESLNGKLLYGDWIPWSDRSVKANALAQGPGQLHSEYVTDANRLGGTSYTDADRLDMQATRTMMRNWLNGYGKVWAQKNKGEITDEVYARMHNGGPRGYRWSSTLSYWKDHVSPILERLRAEKRKKAEEAARQQAAAPEPAPVPATPPVPAVTPPAPVPASAPAASPALVAETIPEGYTVWKDWRNDHRG